MDAEKEEKIVTSRARGKVCRREQGMIWKRITVRNTTTSTPIREDLMELFECTENCGLAEEANETVFCLWNHKYTTATLDTNILRAKQLTVATPPC